MQVHSKSPALMSVIDMIKFNRLNFFDRFGAHVLICCISCVAVMTGCYGNYEQAEVSRAGKKFEIRVSGTFPVTYHDPFTPIFGPFKEISETFIVPRVDGVVYGFEISPPEDDVQYEGVIEFKNKEMKIRLKIRYLTTGHLSRSGWDGTYYLISTEDMAKGQGSKK